MRSALAHRCRFIYPIAARFLTLAVMILSVTVAKPARSGTFPGELSKKSRDCVDCHRDETPSIYRQWGASRHFQANVGCYECHMTAKTGDGSQHAGAFKHYNETIDVLVTPRDCGRCHEAEVEQFSRSRHAKAARVLSAADLRLARVVVGDRGFRTPSFAGGISAALVSGCWQCHGSEVKTLNEGKLDSATWPNTGIGRINPDGSEGACTACHGRHMFSVKVARHPDSCGRCHTGPEHPQIEIYNRSKHGIAFRALIDEMALGRPKWVLGEDYDAAPTCATCHMSATPRHPVSHDVGLRISWNNRPPVSVRPETADAELGLPGAKIPWQKRRRTMTEICSSCHGTEIVRSFYAQYDALIGLYHDKFARPGEALIAIARQLAGSSPFSEPVDFTWLELWHRAGRRARHGASMMGHDIAHTQGIYEVARLFYSVLVPQLRALIERGRAGPDPSRQQMATILEVALDALLERPEHAWFGRADSDTTSGDQR